MLSRRLGSSSHLAQRDFFVCLFHRRFHSNDIALTGPLWLALRALRLRISSARITPANLPRLQTPTTLFPTSFFPEHLPEKFPAFLGTPLCKTFLLTPSTGSGSVFLFSDLPSEPHLVSPQAHFSGSTCTESLTGKGLCSQLKLGRRCVPGTTHLVC